MFVTHNQMLSMLLALIFPLAAAGAGVWFLYCFSDKKKTGIVNALGLGIVAFFCKYVLSSMVSIALIQLVERKQMWNMVMPVTYISTAISSVIAVLSFQWAVKTSNRSRQTLFRGAAAGLGFGVGNVIWNIVVPYVTSLYTASTINMGVYEGADSMAQSVLDTRPLTVMLDSLRSIYFLVIYTALGFIAGKLYLEGKKEKAFLLTLLVIFFGSFVNVRTGNIAATAVVHVLLIALAAVGGWILYQWLMKKDSEA